MAFDINWHVLDGDPVLKSPQYQTYSQKSFESMNINEVKTTLRAALASNESAGVVNYLSWLIRTLNLVA